MQGNANEIFGKGKKKKKGCRFIYNWKCYQFFFKRCEINTKIKMEMIKRIAFQRLQNEQTNKKMIL